MAGIGVLRTIEGGLLGFHCPGCKHMHAIGVKPPATLIWQWNGDYERPTFNPSLLCTGHQWVPPVTQKNIEQWNREPWEQKKVDRVCHSFITDGKIRFLDDCTHELRIQVVQLQREDDDMKTEEQGAQQSSDVTTTPGLEHEASGAKPVGTLIVADDASVGAAIVGALAAEGKQVDARLSEDAGGPFVIRKLTIGQMEKLVQAGVAFEILADGSGAKIPVDAESIESPASEPGNGQTPMHGTALGDILDRVRGAIHQFENHVALEEHDLAKEVHDFILDNVNELRGHFKS